MEMRCCDCDEPIAESMGFVKASALLRSAVSGKPPDVQPARCWKCVERHSLHAEQGASDESRGGFLVLLALTIGCVGVYLGLMWWVLSAFAAYQHSYMFGIH